jgi:hypothetical protein
MSIESTDRMRYPPSMVVAAARHAFREHTRPEGIRAALVFDSSSDDVERERAPRRLIFTGEGFDVMLTVVTTSRGKTVTGEVISDARLAVEIRRPMRATIALPADKKGVLPEAVIPAGPACLVIRTATGETYESNWLTL